MDRASIIKVIYLNESFKNVKSKSSVASQSLLDVPSNNINKHVILFAIQYVQFNEDICT